MATAVLKIDAQSGSVSSAKRDLDGLTGSATRAERAVDRLGDESKETGRQVDGMGRKVSGMAVAMGAAAAAAGALAAGMAAREYVQTADAIAQLRGRIDLYTSSARETAMVMTSLNETATRQGVAFTANAEIYARLAPAQRQLNLSSQQMLDITEAVGASFVVSGASAQEAESAIIQLSQGLASGALRGEEFNSVAEQAPRLNMLLAESLGVTTGELRAMAAEGELTADVVSGALLGGLEELRSEMEEMPATVERSTARLSNALGQLIDTTNQRFGVTTSLASGIDDLAGAVDRLALELSADPADQARLLEIRLESLRGEAERLEAQIGSNILNIQAFGRLNGVTASIAELEDALRDLNVQMESAAEVSGMLSNWEAARQAAANRRAGIVSLDSSVQSLIDSLEEETAAVGRSRLATELYNAEKAKGSELTEAEISAITERVNALEAAEAAERAGIEARREAERAAERQAAAEERAAERLSESTDELQIRIRQEREMVTALGEGEDAVARVTRAQEIENAVREMGLDLTTAEGQAYAELIAQLYDLETARDSQERAMRSQAREHERLVRELEREIDAATSTATKLTIQGFENGWDEALDTVADMIERWVLQNLIFEPIIRPIFDGSGMGGAGGLFGGSGGIGIPGLGGSGGFNPFGLLNAMGGSLGTSLGSFLGNSAINLGAGANTAQFLANAGLRVGNAAPYSMLGGILGNVIGLGGSGNALADAGLNLGGSMLGMSLGGPVGAVLGSLLGQGLGSLFADEDYPYARGDVRIQNGRAVVTGTETLDGASDAEVRAAAEAIAQTINAALGQIGASGNFGGGTTFGQASGRSGALGTGFFAGADGGFTTGATFTREQDPEKAAAQAVAFALSQAIGEGAIDLPAAMGNQFEAAMEIFERNAYDLDQSIADLNFAQNFENALSALEGSALSFSETIEGQARAQIESALAPLDEFIAKTEKLGLDTDRAGDAVETYVRSLLGLTETESLNAAQANLDAINAKFDALADSVTRFGVSVEEVEQGRQIALDNARQGFADQIRNALLDAQGRGYVTEGQRLMDQIAELEAQAAIYGVAMSDVDALSRELVANLLSDLDPSQVADLQATLGADASEYADLFRDAMTHSVDLVDGIAAQIRDVGRQLERSLADSAGADPTLLFRRAFLELEDITRNLDPADFEAVSRAIEDLPPGLDEGADAIRAYMREMRGLTAAHNAAAAAVRERELAERAVSTRRSFLETVYDYEASRIQEQFNQQQANHQARISGLQQEAAIFDRLHDQIADFSRSLIFDDASPVALMDQFAAAQDNFDATIAAALQGDTEAAGRVTSDAQLLLDLNAQINRSGVAGADLFAQVQDQIAQVEAYTGQRADRLSSSSALGVARNQLSVMDSQLSELRALLGISDDGFGSIRQALAEAASAAARQGTTLEEYLAQNADIADFLSERGFDDFAEVVAAAFENVADESLLENFEDRAQAAADRLAEALEDASGEIISNAPEVGDAIVDMARDVREGGNAVGGALHDFADDVGSAAGSLSRALAQAIEQAEERISGFAERSENDFVREMSAVRSEIEALRRENREDAEREARIGVAQVEATERVEDAARTTANASDPAARLSA